MVKPARSNQRISRQIIVAALLPLILTNCDNTVEKLSETSLPEIYAERPDFVGDDTRAPCSEYNPTNNAHFGALHIHTNLSFDSWVFDNNNGPDQAYAYAKGQPMMSGPAMTNDGITPVRLQIDRPLDFAAVTDHSEQFGQISICTNPQHPDYDHKVCSTMRGEEWWAKLLPDALSRLGRIFSSGNRGPMAVDVANICGDDPTCTKASAPVWQQTMRAAENAYDRSESCEFTSMIAFEYSLTPYDTSNTMHRNVFFRNATVLNLPVSARLTEDPVQLWRYLDEACNSANNECEALAVPHNSNFSSGETFYPGYGSAQSIEEEREIAALRQRTEPLVEIYQGKGESECRNGLYRVGGAPDEFCNFEKIHSPNKPVEDCDDGIGEKGTAMTGCVSRRNFVRYVLTEGLQEADRLGVNPFELGIIAATDSHASNGGSVMEYDVRSGLVMNNTPQKRLKPEVSLPGGIATLRPTRFSVGGIAGIFAPQNTREDLFDAMRRRETFGTSGPRIVPRFFAGSELNASLCNDPEMVAKAYQQGVPMGSRVTVNQGDPAPNFLVAAIADTGTTEHPGGLLQRIQIIKGWVDKDGILQQQVFDVAGGANDASVNLNTCQPKGEGYRNLCAVWSDPEFDPSKRAVYYAKVLENPSCRWSTFECNQLSGDDRPATCDDPEYDKTIQERAWTSPIWTYPAKPASTSKAL